MDHTYTVCDADGVVVLNRLTRDEILFLRGLERQPDGTLTEERPAIVRARKRHPNLWVALVDGEVIRATVLRLRGVRDHLPIAEDNFTGGWRNFSTQTKSGRRYELNLAVCFNYPTTAACCAERRERMAA